MLGRSGQHGSQHLPKLLQAVFKGKPLQRQLPGIPAHLPQLFRMINRPANLLHNLIDTLRLNNQPHLILHSQLIQFGLFRSICQQRSTGRQNSVQLAGHQTANQLGR